MTQARSQARPCGISNGQSGGQVYLQVPRFFPVIAIPPMLHYDLHLNTTRKDKREKPENLQTKQCPFLLGGGGEGSIGRKNNRSFVLIGLTPGSAFCVFLAYVSIFQAPKLLMSSKIINSM
jgi:hypothetical protein